MTIFRSLTLALARALAPALTPALTLALTAFCVWAPHGALAAAPEPADPPSAKADRAADLPSDAAIQDTLRRLIEARRGVGLVVGMIDASGRRVIAWGRRSDADPRAPDAETVFEIGSITKTFTALLLADMVRKGEVRLDQPVQELLPPSVRVPQRGGRQITLLDLATQSSGLPRMPANLRPANPKDPYADYTVDRLYAFLNGHTLPRDIGSEYEYSNVGMGLLGHALSLKAGKPFGALVAERVTGPLGMTRTAVGATPQMQADQALGYDEALKPTPFWNMGALEGAGALRSTTDDLLTYLAAELGLKTSPLTQAMADQLAQRRPAGQAALTIGLAWHVLTLPDGREFVWHNGGTYGFRSFVGFDRKRGLGVVVLANAGVGDVPDRVGLSLLAGAPLEAVK